MARPQTATYLLPCGLKTWLMKGCCPVGATITMKLRRVSGELWCAIAHQRIPRLRREIPGSLSGRPE
jgi:hypothetical protein